MNNAAMPKENKMGVMPVGKLLINMSLPMMISMLVLSLYNIVDSIFVAQINENALTAVSLAFPVQNLMIAVGMGTCVGVNALLSKSLGEKNYERANASARNAIFLMAISFVVFFLFGVFCTDWFYGMQTTEPEIAEFGHEYMVIICCMSFGIYLQAVMEKLLQSTGKTLYAMFSQLIGAITNLILDPIMIFGLLGFPKMGVSGAAIATVIGQLFAGIFATYMNVKYNTEININMRHFRPNFHIIGRIYAVGVPSIIMQSVTSLMVYGMNLILITFSTTATAVLGVYFKIQSFIFMPLFGMNNGMIPIIAYNYGADSRKRVTGTIKYSMLVAFCIMATGFAIFQIFPDRLLQMFNASDMMLALGVPALRTISYSFILAGYCIIAGSAFQALGNGVYSLIMSVMRQLVVLLPAAYFLAQLGNVDLVWLSFPIAELMSFATATFFLFKINRKIISTLH
ncbi:MAG: MATE family efflux transporter [Lachnospiraceae bacterium]|nr:MATE family efflux transporter [Lachnospiraceae bacterium]